MIVTKQKPIEFSNTCLCLVNLKELERAILWYQDRPTARLKKIYIYGHYPTVSIHQRKIFVHRLLMMYWLQDKNLPIFVHVHHENEDPFDSRKSNLSCLLNTKHLSFHNKGKKLSAEHRVKISLANYRRWERYHDKEAANG